MPTPVLSEEAIREAIDAVALHGSQAKAAQAMGLARATLQHRLKEAARILTQAAKRIRSGESVRDVAAGWLTLFWPLVGGFSCCGNSVGFEPTAGGASPKSCQSRTVP